MRGRRVRVWGAAALVAVAAPPSATGAPAAPADRAVPDTVVVPLTLAETVGRARESSARLASVAARRDAAGARLREARGARLPELEVSAGYTRYSDVPELSIALPGGQSRTLFPNIPDNYRARASVSLPLFTGGRLSAAVAAAREERAAAGGDHAAADAALVLETTAAYWELVTARENERVVREALAAYDAHLADARNRERVGLAARNEVLAVAVERDRAELALLSASNAARVANADLVRLAGLSPARAGSGPTIPPARAVRVGPSEPLREGFEDGAGVGPGVDDADLDALVAAALSARPERAALAARAAAARARARAEKSGWLPAASFVAGYDEASPNRRILPPEARWEDSWDVSLQLSWTLFDGGRTSAAVARSEALARAAENELEDLDQRIRLEVTARALEREAARAAVDIAARGVASGEENLRVSRDLYREGVRPSSELLDAEVALLRARLDQTASLAGLRLARAHLHRAVGR